MALESKRAPKPVLRIERLDAIFFDFDGVLTDNKVYISQNGSESVCCSRADGLAFDVLRKTNLRLFIISRETSPVVKARAAKLKISAAQTVTSKVDLCRQLARKEKFSLRRALFVGNDLNDYDAMRLCGYSACPADSHPAIKKIAQIVLKTKGGQGVVSEVLEDVLGVDIIARLR
jgi:3-deoxy-D-manno-octulosonate 8-phosphate phosphatase (KDO 8-P phosphatase)